MFTIKYWVPFISSYCKPILGNKCISTLGHRRATAVGFMVGSSFCWFQQIQTYECVKIVIPEKQGWQSEKYTPIPVYQCNTLIGCSCLVVKVVIQWFIFMLLGFIQENLRKIHKFDTVVLLLGDGSTSGYPAPKQNYWNVSNKPVGLGVFFFDLRPVLSEITRPHCMQQIRFPLLSLLSSCRFLLATLTGFNRSKPKNRVLISNA